jgi:hypothetical protein
MSYHVYKLLHFVGIFMVLVALGGIGLHMATGGTKEFANRKLIGMIHGLGLFLSLFAGFGLLARLGLVQGMPAWAVGKLVVWLLLGGIPALFYRKQKWAKSLMGVVLVLAVLNAWLAVYKPMSSSPTAPDAMTAPATSEDAVHFDDEHAHQTQDSDHDHGTQDAQ